MVTNKKSRKNISNTGIFLKKKNTVITDDIFWTKIKSQNIASYIDKIKYLLYEFGTKEPCNRFDVGNTIEFIIGDMIRNIGFDVNELPNASKIDLCINQHYKLSVKYSSIGDITMHNSNSCINKDLTINDLLLLTKDKLYLITNNMLKQHNIVIDNYIKNAGDSLKLQRKILKVLENNKYPFILDFDINIDKKKCKNRLCSKIFYDFFLTEYNYKLTTTKKELK